MKSNILPVIAAIGGLALAHSASAQVLGGSVGGAVGGTLGAPGAGASGALGGNAGADVTRPRVDLPDVAAPPVTRPTPPTPPPVTLPDASAHGQATASANAHAGPASATVSADLDAMATGMAVHDAAGRTIGRVSRIVRNKAGQIESVLVATSDKAGRTVRYAAGDLSLSGEAVIAADAETH